MSSYLEEEEEDRFSDSCSAKLWIFERVFNIGLSQEDVSSAGSPQHLLEGRKSFTKDDAGDKAKMNASVGGKDGLFGNELLILSVVTLCVDLQKSESRES